MKKKILSLSKYVFCSAMLSILCTATDGTDVFAADGDVFSSNGLKYEVVSEEDKTVGVKGYESVSAELTIPATVTNGDITYSVTSVYGGAFENNTTITTLTLSEGITTLYGASFGKCTSLTTVTIPATLTLADDSYNSSYGGWTGPFSGCSALTTVNLSEKMTTIPANLFNKVTGLVSITLPENITTIGGSAFCDCTNLTSITLPERVTKIDGSAFENCTALASVSLNDDLAEINGKAFHNCTSLTSIDLPKSLTSVDDVYSSGDGGWCGPFSACTNLKTVNFALGTTKIPASLFINCPGIETITIPDTVTIIGGSAFANCPNLTTVNLSKNLTTIEGSAFENSQKLTGVVLPLRLTSIGGMAFGNCTSLTSIEIPKSVTTFDDVYSSGNGGWCGPFTKSGIKSVTFENGRTSISANVFRRCPELETIVLPESVTKIDSNAFSDCPKLTAFTIPTTVTSIGSEAFAYTGLTEFVIPNSVTELGNGVVAHCKALTSVTIPETITVIPEKFAEGCTSLTEVKLPAYSVTEIKDRAFISCAALSNIELPASLAYMGAAVFSETGLTSATLPSQLRSMGANVFENCKKLETVILSAGLTELPAATFKGCDLLISADIPYRVKKVGNEAYANCFSLTSISIPKSVAEIASTAFSYPGSMTINGIEASYAQNFANENMITFTTAVFETTAVTLHNSKVLQSDTVIVKKGDVYSIVAALNPTASTQEVTWTSSNPDTVTVDNDGNVTAVGGGTAVITATSGAASASCTFVVELPLSELDLDIHELTFNVIGAHTVINLIKTPATATDEIIWTSSNPEVVTVDQTGKVTAVSEGTAVITVASTVNPDIKTACNVEVIKVNLTTPTLSVVSGGYNKLNLSWNKVENASGYEIYRYDSKLKDYKKIKDITKGNILTYVDTGLGGFSYKYKIRAVTTSYTTMNYSALSAEASATPTPNQVTGVKQGSYSTSHITLKWTKQTGVTGYQIVKSSSKNGKYTVAATVTKNASSYTIKNVGAGKGYYYKIRSYKNNSNGKAVYGAYSDAVKMVTKPSASTVTLKKTGGTRIKVTWTKSTGANTYEVYMSTRRTSGFTKVKTVNTGRTLGFTQTGLKKGTTYYFKVRAYKMHGTAKVYSGWSTVKSLKL